MNVQTGSGSVQEPSIDFNTWRERIRNDTYSNYHYHMGLAMLREGSAAGALAALRRAISIKPDLMLAHLDLLLALQALKRSDEVSATLRQLVDKIPNLPIYGAIFAARRMLTDEQGRQLGRGLIDLLAPLAPWGDRLAALGKAVGESALFLAINQLFDAIQDVGLGVPSDVMGEAFWEFFEILGNNGHASALSSIALKGWELSGVAEQRNVDFITHRGYRFRIDCHLADSALMFELACRLNENDPESQCQWGVSLLLLERWDDAESALGRSLILDPHHLLSALFQALGRLARSDVQGALPLFDRLDRQSPPFAAWGQSFGGLALQAAGRLNDAIERYRTAVERAPEYGWAHANLGLGLLGAGRLDEAEVVLRKALDLENDYWQLSNLALVLEAQGRRDEAMMLHRRSLSHDPEWIRFRSRVRPWAFESLSNTYRQLGFDLEYGRS